MRSQTFDYSWLKGLHGKNFSVTLKFCHWNGIFGGPAACVPTPAGNLDNLMKTVRSEHSPLARSSSFCENGAPGSIMTDMRPVKFSPPFPKVFISSDESSSPCAKRGDWTAEWKLEEPSLFSYLPAFLFHSSFLPSRSFFIPIFMTNVFSGKIRHFCTHPSAKTSTCEAICTESLI